MALTLNQVIAGYAMELPGVAPYVAQDTTIPTDIAQIILNGWPTGDEAPEPPVAELGGVYTITIPAGFQGQLTININVPGQSPRRVFE